jgi:hypothetical protein
MAKRDSVPGRVEEELGFSSEVLRRCCATTATIAHMGCGQNSSGRSPNHEIIFELIGTAERQRGINKML